MGDATKPAFRVILLTHGGSEKVLECLAAVEGVQLVGVFVETKVIPNRSFTERIKRSVRYDGYTGTVAKLARKFFGKSNGEDDETRISNDRNSVAEVARTHNVPFHLVDDYHSAETRALIAEAHADLGVVWGTNILKETVFRIPRLGCINLHQGLAPIYRGGPPIFWELFNDERELGLTIHFVGSKVDSGDIIVQETIPLEYDYQTYGTHFETFLADYSKTLVEQSANLVAKAVGLIAAGQTSWLPQDVSLGKRYRLPIKTEKDQLRRRLRERYKTEARRDKTAGELVARNLRAGDR